MTHEEALSCKDTSHLIGEMNHTFGGHCAPCCASLRIYGKVLDSVAGQHRLASLLAEKAAADKSAEKYRSRKDYKMVAGQAEHAEKIDNLIAELETEIGKGQGRVTKRLIQQYSGKGKLVFRNGQPATVNYSIDEFQQSVSDAPGEQLPLNRRGRVSHAEGHPDWHPIAALQLGRPLILEMSDGRKLTVFLESLRGDVQGTGDLF